MIDQLLLNGIIAASIYALGFALIYQTTRFFFAFADNASAGQARQNLPDFASPTKSF